MAGKSKVWGLPGVIRSLIDTKLTGGATLDEAHEAAVLSGADISRSSIARYAKALKAESNELRQLTAISSALLRQMENEGTIPEDILRVLSMIMTARLQKQVLAPDDNFDNKSFERACRGLKSLSQIIKENPARDLSQGAVDTTDPNVRALLDLMQEQSHD